MNSWIFLYRYSQYLSVLFIYILFNSLGTHIWNKIKQNKTITFQYLNSTQVLQFCALKNERDGKNSKQWERIWKFLKANVTDKEWRVVMNYLIAFVLNGVTAFYLPASSRQEKYCREFRKSSWYSFFIRSFSLLKTLINDLKQ